MFFSYNLIDMRLYKIPHLDRGNKTRFTLGVKGFDGQVHTVRCGCCGKPISDKKMRYRNPNTGRVSIVPVLTVRVNPKSGIKEYYHRHCKLYYLPNQRVRKGDGYANVRGRCFKWRKRR